MGDNADYLKRELYERVRTDPALFDWLQAGSLDGIWYWDLEQQENEWLSPRFKETFGYTDDEVPNTSSWWLDHIFKEDGDKAIATLKAHLADGTPYDQVVRYRHRNGSTVWVRCRGLAIRDENGKPIRMLGAHTDVTEQKVAELRAVEAAAARTRFLAHMSHEIRTPLHGILGIVELLRNGAVPDPGAQRELLDTVAESGETLLAIINDLLDLSRIDAAGLTIHPEPTAPAPVLTSLYRLYQEHAAAKGLRYELDVSSAVQGVWLQLDPHRLRQIVGNLISNAVKFTRSGFVRIEADLDARTGTAADGDGAVAELVVRVRDSGPGIADTEAIFEPFEQADAGPTRRHDGTGLGLAIVRQLTQLLGGTIVVDSTPDMGSLFVLRLPAPIVTSPRESPAGRPAADRLATGSQEARLSRLAVLVAEDHPTNRLVLRHMLTTAGVSDAVFVTNGAAAAAACRERAFDVVLMDVHMPVMNGWDAAAAIRAEGKGSPRIVALTADAFPESRAACIEAGMEGFLAKPFDPRALIAELTAEAQPV
jgi:PAS domain S-box-containing protein